MGILKIIILLFVILNIPGWILVTYSSSLSSFLSIITIGLLLFYYLISKKRGKIPISMVILGFLYFIISMISDSTNTGNLIVVAIKYFVFICTVPTLIKDSSIKELVLILFLGSLSLFVDILISSDNYGRYAGFYLNPNSASFICLIGFWFSDYFSSKYVKFILKVFFLLAGLVTFSRTFLLILFITILVSIFLKKSNFIIFLGSFIILLLFLFFSKYSNFNSSRLQGFQSLAKGNISNEMTYNSRDQTWSRYLDDILNKPFFGNGYLNVSGKKRGDIIIDGVHNTPLMIMGEAGILPFLLFSLIYFKCLIISFRQRKINEINFLVSLSLFIYLLTTHNFFDNFIVLTISLWINFLVNQNVRIGLNRK